MERVARLPKRYLRLFFAFCSVLAFWSLWYATPEPTTTPRLVPYPAVEDTPLINDPPAYERYREYEDALSQQGGDDLQRRKYLYFANHAWGCGWGNVLQEMLMSALLAHDARRRCVVLAYTGNLLKCSLVLCGTTTHGIATAGSTLSTTANAYHPESHFPR